MRSSPNYLVHCAWIAEGRAPASLQGNNGNNTFFAVHGVAAELSTHGLTHAPEPPPFFSFISTLSDPDGLFDNQTADMFDEPEDSLVCLYLPNIGLGEESGGGLFYHQGHHRATVVRRNSGIRHRSSSNTVLVESARTAGSFSTVRIQFIATTKKLAYA
ncbi:hypothetical protein VTI74DRAFT_10668 [Chaetomium olivicolor]